MFLWQKNVSGWPLQMGFLAAHTMWLLPIHSLLVAVKNTFALTLQSKFQKPGIFTYKSNTLQSKFQKPGIFYLQEQCQG